MILSFSDDEEDIYNGILEVISNNKSLEWCNTFQDTEIQVGELEISLAQRSVSVNNIEVRLTKTEFEILYLLASNPGRVFTIEQICNIIWNYEYLGDCATISHHISSIRKKIGDRNSKENAKMWRKDLADTINSTNEQLGIDLHWEHRSFKEQGIDREPTTG